MGFFGKLKKKLKPKNLLKHANPKVALKGLKTSLSKKNIASAIKSYEKVQKNTDGFGLLVKKVGGKKASAVYGTAMAAVGDIWTFGGASAGKALGQRMLAVQKAKDDAAKQQKLTNTMLPMSSMNCGGNLSTYGQTQLDADPLASSQFDQPQFSAQGGFGEAFDQGLGFLDRTLDQFGGGAFEPALPGPEQGQLAQEESGAVPSQVPFLLIGGGALLLIAALRK